MSDNERLKDMAALNALLVQLRSLMPSVSKEISVSMPQLEAIQRSLRLCMSALEILSSRQPGEDDAAGRRFVQIQMKADNRRIQEMLVGAARALKFGTPGRLGPLHGPAAAVGENVPPADLSGYVSLTAKLSHEIEQLRQRLRDTAPQWNI